MSPNRRIFLNVIATYGRSLYALGLGLFSARWVLLTLGDVDYGLWGLITGMTGFISFFNVLLSSAIGRFYAVAEGMAKKNLRDGIEISRKWFSTALVIQVVIPTILFLIGYPIGEWVIRNYLTIPSGRVDVCVVVWRFACAGCFIGMATVPFSAIYIAKQEIAELTAYSLISTTLNFCFVYYMYTHAGDWLLRYSAITCCITAIPQLLICVRSVYVYPECRFVLSYGLDMGRFKKLFSFVGWQIVGNLGWLLKWQGMSILINKSFGARVNAANSVGMGLVHHCNGLAASVQGSFSPAIMNAYGEGNMERARHLAFQACRLSVFCILIFAVPLILEIDEVLKLWLKNPPQYAAGFAIWVLVDLVIDRTTTGYMVLVDACGRIAAYQVFYGLSIASSLPLAWVLVKCGLGVCSVWIAIVVTKLVCTWGRVWMARGLVGLDFVGWLRRVMVPILILGALGMIVGLLPKLFMPASFCRVCVTTLTVELVLIVVSWFALFDSIDKKFFYERMPLLRKIA